MNNSHLLKDGNIFFIVSEIKIIFFVALLVSSGIGAMIGGVVTALVVKYAKVAYAILIGFILLFIAMLDVIIFPFHPTFYKISIFSYIFSIFMDWGQGC